MNKLYILAALGFATQATTTYDLCYDGVTKKAVSADVAFLD